MLNYAFDPFVSDTNFKPRGNSRALSQRLERVSERLSLKGGSGRTQATEGRKDISNDTRSK